MKENNEIKSSAHSKYRCHFRTLRKINSGVVKTNKKDRRNLKLS